MSDPDHPTLPAAAPGGAGKRPDAHDLAATIPMSAPAPAGRGDAHDAIATIPMGAETGTAPAAPASPSEPATVRTAPASSDAATLPAGTAPAGGTALTGGATAATLVAVGPATSAGTSATAATLPVGTGGGTGFASQAGGTGSLSRTGLGRTLRTRINPRLDGQDRDLDQRLQTARPSVLADMATTRMSRGASIPRSIAAQIEAQGTEGRYVIDRFLAKGGMGAVMLIEDHDFRRQAAMKVIKSDLAGSSDAVERFLAEAQVTAQLEHPNIVPVHDLGVMEDGTLFYTMTFIQGRSLMSVVKLLRQHRGLANGRDGVKPPDAESEEAARTWTEEQKLIAFLKVLDGVGYAHARGVVHRDLKPDNIMLGAHGQVLVVDWGIAKVMRGADRGDALVRQIEQIADAGAAARAIASVRDGAAASETIAGSAMGTPHYMPPEQATGDLERVDARSDIYALGATLFELISLEKYIVGSSLPELLAKVTTGQWRGLDQVAPATHPDLVAIIHKAMSLDPARRYGACAEMAADIRSYMAGKAVAARRRGVGELLLAWIVEHRVKLMAGTAAIVLTAGAIAGTVAWIRGEQRADGERLLGEVRQEIHAAGFARDDLAAVEAAIAKLGRAGVLLGEGAIADERSVLDAARGAILARREQEQRAAAARQAGQDAAVAALAAARSALERFAVRGDENDLAEARGQLNIAEYNVPRDEAGKALLNDIAAARADAEAQFAKLSVIKRQRIARDGLAEARTLLERLGGLDPAAVAAEFDGLAARIDEHVRLADREGIEGAGEAARRLTALRLAATAARQRAQAEAAAAANAAKAQSLAATARARDPGAAEAVQELSEALGLLRQAQAQRIEAGIEPAASAGRSELGRRIDDVAGELAARRAQIKRIDALAAAGAALDRIPALVARGELDEAGKWLGVADSAAPTDDPALRERVRAATVAISDARLAAARAARLAADLAEAERLMAQARESLARLQAAATAMLAADGEVRRLEPALQAAPEADKADLFAKRALVQRLRGEVAERWSETEAAASRALARLAEQPDHPLDGEVRNLLAQIYYRRLQTARREQQLPEIRAYTNLIERLGPKVAGINLAGEGRLRIEAAPGTSFTARRMEVDGGGRLAPSGEPVALVAGVERPLPSGRWLIEGPGGTRTAIVLAADQALGVRLPTAAPAVAGHRLSWVPALPGGPQAGFWMGTDEVSLGQYAEFLNDPQILKEINADLAAAQANGLRLGEEGRERKVRHLPTAIGLANMIDGDIYDLRIEPAQRDQPVTRIIVAPGVDPKAPVRMIDRNDADAFCRWLAKRAGASVRLPTAAEWAWAATGGDEQRIYPWGPQFDGAFTIGAWFQFRSADKHPLASGTAASDIGPFGHRDLGGNVREWLHDRARGSGDPAAGPRGGLVAGGGYTDSRAADMQSASRDSVAPGDPHPAIGFRILVPAESVEKP